MDEMKAKRAEKETLTKQFEALIKSQTPLKWVNRVIMWCADKMPSMADKVKGGADLEVPVLVDKALESSKTDTKSKRQALIDEAKK